MSSEWNELKEKAEKKLMEEGKIPHREKYSEFQSEFWHREATIREEAEKMRDRKKFEELKKKHNW